MDLLGFAHDRLVRGGGGLECQRKQQTPDAYASGVFVMFTAVRLLGGSEGRRSPDLTIFSRALYQLSYRALSQLT